MVLSFEQFEKGVDMQDIDSFLELVKSRRTVRGYQQKEVPQECVEKILEAARWAPSGGNSQPWEFVIITDPEMRRRIVELYVKQLEDKREMERVVRGPKASAGSGTGFQHAPVFILVLGDERVNGAFPIRTYLDKGEQHFTTGLASATLMIHLAAASLGLGCQWLSDSASPYMATMLKSWLDIPMQLRIYDLVTLGYPTRLPPAPPRRELSEMVHWGAYDSRKARSDAEIHDFLMKQTRLGNFGRRSEEGT